MTTEPTVLTDEEHATESSRGGEGPRVKIILQNIFLFLIFWSRLYKRGTDICSHFEF